MKYRYATPSPEILAQIRRAETAVAGQKSRKLLCPYCHHCALIVYEGTHGYIQAKCKVCGRETVFSTRKVRRIQDNK